MRFLRRITRILWFSFFITWEQRKVNSICEKTYGGGTPSTSDSEFWSGEIPWIQSSDIVEHNVLDVTVRKRISNKAICFSAAQRIPANSIAIITRVGVGKLAFMPFSYTTSQDFLSLSGLRVNALFATYALYVKLQNDMNIVQGTSIKGITKEELLAKEIAVPICPLEQERICTLFKVLDNLITLHQRKQKDLFFLILSKKLSLILANDWEQRKVSNMFKVTRGYVLAATLTSADQTAETPYPVFSSQTKDKGLMGYYKDYLYEDAITWTTDGANAGTVNFRAGKFYCTNVCGVLLTDSVKASPAVAEALNNVAKSYVSYVGNPKLMNNVMADIEIYIPFAQTEQEKISQVFTTLDNLITLHQCKENLVQSKYEWHSLFQMQYKLADDWEQRKLGDIGRVAMNRRIFKEQTSAEGSVPFYKIGTFGGEPDAFISDELYQEYKERFPYPKVGDILLSASGSIGKMVEYKGEKAYFQDSNIVWLDHDASVSNAFLKCFYSVVKWAGLEGSTIKRLYNKNILETQIALPSYAEQCLIGDFFEHIDNLITLHQCKRAAFFDWKRWLYSKFEESKITLAWEQRKVYEVAERYDNLRVPVAANLRVRGNIPYYGANGIQDYVDGFTHDGEFVLVAEDGANDLKNYPVQRVNGRIWVNNHAHVLQGKPDLMDNLFFAYSLHRADIASFLVGGSRAKLNADTLMTLELLLPCVVEQTKIGRLFDNLDNLITLHQRGEKINNRRQT